jgi:tetratricopeptide (TPR) repeat protein
VTRSVVAGLLAVIAIMIGPSAYGESDSAASRAVALKRSPYDHQARRALLMASRAERDYADAFYQAAWLSWLAPRRYADSNEGVGYLMDRRARDRAARAAMGSVVTVLVAVDGARRLHDSCFNGAVVQQAPKIADEIEAAIAQAEAQAGARAAADPVERIALARSYLTLDDAIALTPDRDTRRLRERALRKAAAHCAAVCEELPESSGAHRTMSIIRARVAELDNQAELWDSAIASCMRARELDPDDLSLAEMLWTLHLRAGHWQEAKRWEQLCSEGSTRSDASAASAPR